MNEEEIDEMFAKCFQESLELWKKALPTAASYDPDELLKPTEKELRECGLWLSPEKGEYPPKATKRNQTKNKQHDRFFDQEIWSDDEDDDIVGGETHPKLTQPEKGFQVSAGSNVLRVDSSTKQISIEQVEGSEAKTSSRYTFRKRRTGSKAYWHFFFRAKKPVKGMNELLPSASIGLDTGEEIFGHLREFKEQAKQRHNVKKARAVKKTPKKAKIEKLGSLKQTSTKASQKKLGGPRKKFQAKAATKKDQGFQVSAGSNVLRVNSSTKQISIDEQVDGSEAETNSRYTFRKRHTGSKVVWDYPSCANKPVKRSRR